MDANIHTLFSSDHYEISDFKCLCNECTRSKTEYNEHLSLSFIRSGNFYYNTFRESLDSYTGSVLVSKAGYDYTVTHQGKTPDECTIIVFKRSFYEDIEEQLQLKAHWFFSNKDIQSLLLKTTPETEQLHYTLLQVAKQNDPYKLELDTIVMELVEATICRFTGYELPQLLSTRLKKHHIPTIEKAKQYMSENLSGNISLEDLSKTCCVSPFHFSRIFKLFTGYAAHQYLQLMRLKHAQILLATTLPIADIAFQSGFNSIDYFSAAFKKEYKISPSGFRANQKNSRISQVGLSQGF